MPTMVPMPLRLPRCCIDRLPIHGRSKCRRRGHSKRGGRREQTLASTKKFVLWKERGPTRFGQWAQCPVKPRAAH